MPDPENRNRATNRWLQSSGTPTNLFSVNLFRLTRGMIKWMNAQNDIAATARQKMNGILTRALKEQGKCSRADWLNQLDRIHGKTKGPLPTFGNENRYSDIA